MEKADDTRPEDPRRKRADRPTRRDFVKTGAAAGLGAGALLGANCTDAQRASSGPGDTAWDYEVDVVVAAPAAPG